MNCRGKQKVPLCLCLVMLYASCDIYMVLNVQSTKSEEIPTKYTGEHGCASQAIVCSIQCLIVENKLPDYLKTFLCI